MRKCKKKIRSGSNISISVREHTFQHKFGMILFEARIMVIEIQIYREISVLNKELLSLHTSTLSQSFHLQVKRMRI